MSLTIELLRRLEEPGLAEDEIARRRCALAEELEEAGNYEAAARALGDLWSGVGERPRLEGFDATTRARLLLRAGSLTGWLGSARRLVGAQEQAKDLLCESKAVFESADKRCDSLRAQVELSWCYWREGAYDDARAVLRDAAQQAGRDDAPLLALTLVRLAEVERSAERYEAAREVLKESEAHVLAHADDALKGKFHSTRAGVLESLAYRDGREDLADLALIELAAASFHFAQAGHLRYRAAAENNLGFSYLRLGRLAEAHEHLICARRIYAGLEDEARVAQVDETRARALLAQGRNAEAERVLRPAIKMLERCDERAQLSEALMTLGTAQARLDRAVEARLSLTRAAEVNLFLGETEAVARTLITTLEELRATLARDEYRKIYLQADERLSGSRDSYTLSRLRDCARFLIAPESRPDRESLSANTPQFVHASEESMRLLREARSLARGSGAILLSGETGTGKEVLSRLLHEWSERTGRFVAVNCAALSESLFESQVFGHRKGSFTDALAEHAGLAHEADGGTLYLDEVGEMSLANQAKLLRLVEGGEFYPVGSCVAVRSDVRVVAATNHHLEERVARGLFRADLFYRLAALRLHIPPLRERPGDIPALARHFIAEIAPRYAKRVEFTPESIEEMARLPLAGNARELRGLIERTFLTADDGATITAESVSTLAARQHGKGNFAAAWEGCSFEEEVRAFESRLINLALKSAKGSVTRAARLLNITHQGLAYMLKGRHKDLLSSRKPAHARRASIIAPESRARLAEKR